MYSFLGALTFALFIKDRLLGVNSRSRNFDFAPVLDFFSKELLDNRGGRVAPICDFGKSGYSRDFYAQIVQAKMSGKSLVDPLGTIVEILTREVKTSISLRRGQEFVWWRGIVVLAVNSIVFFLMKQVEVEPSESSAINSPGLEIGLGISGTVFLMFPFLMLVKFNKCWASTGGSVSAFFRALVESALNDEASGCLVSCDRYSQLWNHQWTEGVSTRRQRLNLIQQFAEKNHLDCASVNDRLIQVLPLIEAVAWTAATACLLGPKLADALITVDAVR